MKGISIIVAAAMASAFTMQPVLAQHVTPADTDFEAVSDIFNPVFFSKVTFPSQNCNLVLTGHTGLEVASSGPHADHAADGSIYGGTNTGPGLCSSLVVDPTTFTIDTILSSGSLYEGTLDHLVVRLAGTSDTLCDEYGVKFTIDNGGLITFDSTVNEGTIPGECYVFAELQTQNDLIVGVD